MTDSLNHIPTLIERLEALKIPPDGCTDWNDAVNKCIAELRQFASDPANSCEISVINDAALLKLIEANITWNIDSRYNTCTLYADRVVTALRPYLRTMEPVIGGMSFHAWVQKHLEFPVDDEFKRGWNCAMQACLSFVGQPPEPVSVSLEKCTRAVKDTRTDLENKTCKALAKAVLDAAGVKYVD